MKKASLALVLLLALVLTLVVGCGGNDEPTSSSLPPGERAETSSDYVGLWHASPVVGSGFSERLELNANGTFYWAENEMDGVSRERFSSGTWSINNGVLTLSVTEKLAWEGGALEFSPIYGSDVLVNTTLALVEEPGTLSYQISTIATDPEVFDKRTFTANGTQYWELGEGPNSLSKEYEDARAKTQQSA